jgi:RNA polymerase sigma-70 factor, ECF subfamily
MHILKPGSRLSAEELFFEELYKKYYMRGVYYAHQYLNDYELSKEFTQDAFMIIWERRNSLDFDLNMGSYLFSIIRNKCLNAIRDQLKKNKTLDSDKSIELLINQRALMDDSSVRVLNEELSSLINSTLREMPENIRSVFIMNRDLDLTYKEIATKLGLTEKAIEYRMSKALALFRKSLADYLPIIFLSIIFRVYFILCNYNIWKS